MRDKVWAAWKAHSANVRTHHGIPRNSQPWTTRKGTRLRGIPASDRVYDLVDTAFAVEQVKNPTFSTAELVDKLQVDVSQAVQRRPWKRGGRAILCGTMLYDYRSMLICD